MYKNEYTDENGTKYRKEIHLNHENIEWAHSVLLELDDDEFSFVKLLISNAEKERELIKKFVTIDPTDPMK